MIEDIASIEVAVQSKLSLLEAGGRGSGWAWGRRAWGRTEKRKTKTHTRTRVHTQGNNSTSIYPSL